MKTPRLRGRVHAASEMPQRPDRVYTAQGSRGSEADPGRRPRDSRLVSGVVPRFVPVPLRPTKPAGGCLPCPRPHAPVLAVRSLSYILQYCRQRKKNSINPLQVTWLSPNLPAFLSFRPLRQYSAPAAGRRPGGFGQALLAAAGRGLGGQGAGLGRAVAGQGGARAPAALPREAGPFYKRSSSSSDWSAGRRN